MRIPAPVRVPIGVTDKSGTVYVSPAWMEWFERLLSFYEETLRWVDPANPYFGQVEPTNPTDGLLAYADGSVWDPGSGEGVYRAKSLGGVVLWEYASAIDATTFAPLAAFNDHSARHENGGTDEISVLGLSGLLADGQTPLAHANEKHSTAFQATSGKSQANGYASLDAGVKVPTAELGGSGADASKYLRGDQTWNTPLGGGGYAPMFLLMGA